MCFPFFHHTKLKLKVTLKEKKKLWVRFSFVVACRVAPKFFPTISSQYHVVEDVLNLFLKTERLKMIDLKYWRPNIHILKNLGTKRIIFVFLLNVIRN